MCAPQLNRSAWSLHFEGNASRRLLQRFPSEQAVAQTSRGLASAWWAEGEPAGMGRRHRRPGDVCPGVRACGQLCSEAEAGGGGACGRPARPSRGRRAGGGVWQGTRTRAPQGSVRSSNCVTNRKRLETSNTAKATAKRSYKPCWKPAFR